MSSLPSQWSLQSQWPKNRFKNHHPMKSLLKKSPPKRHQLFRKKLQLFRNKSRNRKVLKKVQKKCRLRKHQSLQKSQSKNKNPHLKKNPLKKPLKSQQWLPRNP